MAAAAKPRPTTVYLDPELARAIKIKAAMTERSVSQLINEALRAQRRLDEAEAVVTVVRVAATAPS